ncbi:TIGR00180 family glycosyltransferase [Methanocalculus sp. MC3]
MENKILTEFENIFCNDISKAKDITFIVLTYNRPYYLQRLLQHYDQIGVHLSFIIADSSSDNNKEKNINICNSCRTIKVQYLPYESNIFFYKLVGAVKKVSTPYVKLCADDDFFLLGGTIKAITFLSSHKEYFVACGPSTGFNYDENQKIIRFSSTKGYLSFDDNTPHKRVLDFFLSPTSTYYGVHDTQFLRKIFKYMLESGFIVEPGTNYGSFFEYYYYTLVLLYSKIYIMPNIMNINDSSSESQWDVNRGSESIKNKISGSLIIFNPITLLKDYLHVNYMTWKSFNRLKSNLPDHICANTNVSKEESIKIGADLVERLMRHKGIRNPIQLLINCLRICFIYTFYNDRKEILIKQIRDKLTGNVIYTNYELFKENLDYSELMELQLIEKTILFSQSSTLKPNFAINKK